MADKKHVANLMDIELSFNKSDGFCITKAKVIGDIGFPYKAHYLITDELYNDILMWFADFNSTKINKIHIEPSLCHLLKSKDDLLVKFTNGEYIPITDI